MQPVDKYRWIPKFSADANRIYQRNLIFATAFELTHHRRLARINVHGVALVL
jgi:hypothetical protein